MNNRDRLYIEGIARSVTNRLDQLIHITRHNLQLNKETIVELDQLQAEVQANTDATSAVGTVVERLIAAFEAAKDDPAEVQALVDQVRANTEGLVSSTLAGTGALGDGEEPPPEG